MPKFRMTFAEWVDGELHQWELELEDFYWCFHCECAHSAEEWDKHGWNCPNEDNGCEGGGFPDEWNSDAWAWSEYRQKHPSAPITPEPGKLYPFYPLPS